MSRPFTLSQPTVAAVLAVLAMSATAHAAKVAVLVTGVSSAKGHVRVELCTKRTFLTQDCPYGGESPATVGDTVVEIASVTPGTYAAQAFLDDTDAGRVHQNVLGIPRERIGFSNDAPLRVRGPRFEDAAFVVGAEARRITLRLRRLFGGL